MKIPLLALAVLLAPRIAFAQTESAASSNASAVFPRGVGWDSRGDRLELSPVVQRLRCADSTWRVLPACQYYERYHAGYWVSAEDMYPLFDADFANWFSSRLCPFAGIGHHKS